MATRAEAWLRQGMLVEAIEDVDEVLGSNPIHAHALVVKGDALFQQCLFEHALVFYERGLRLTTENLNGRFNIGKTRATESIM